MSRQSLKILPPRIENFSMEDLSICEYPTWNLIQIVIDELKEYKIGVDLTRNLISAVTRLKNESEKLRNDKKRLDRALETIWLAHLRYLDMADNWYEYIKVYNY
jgi:FtsZ-binding cell division protein ZapB